MVFEVRSCAAVATGPQERLVRVGGRCRAAAVGAVDPPRLLVGGLRVAPREARRLGVGPEWSSFALTYAVPASVPGDGWLLEVAPPPDAELEAAHRALEAVEAIHARLDLVEGAIARLSQDARTRDVAPDEPGEVASDRRLYHWPLAPGGVS